MENLRFFQELIKQKNIQTIEMPKNSNLSLLDKDSLFIPSSFERITLYEKFKFKIIHNCYLDRTLVSFQANKQSPFSSWFKYREGFSERLVTYLLKEFQPQPGIMLDPFSGSGSSLFAANALNWQTIGIEVLPVGITVCINFISSFIQNQEVCATQNM
ncbi:DNA methyltransferase [Nodularia spumigena CS-584]|nr:DNA methyltransferase [Nodularia spumigena]MDB9384545.1 DNA methyltransferase [Nodularia spumigena CS-584]MEA5554902.1 DNA methyltransferase [Nodularia spumigena CH309]AHJ29664.1 Modification methylase AvaI [Nodularia spumigena CCY9414]EAW44925.1 site-specific DNA-methyltransferase (cytosine-specific) [Nodularia spumigena CCY9414]MEA5609962.1 DNA methyltransferase [Nodularia spumigena UHCC 0060]